MTHNHIYDIFKQLFPLYINEDVIYFQNGKNSIRLRGLTGFYRKEFVFTYNSPLDWKFETVESFIDHMLKGVNK